MNIYNFKILINDLDTLLSTEVKFNGEDRKKEDINMRDFYNVLLKYEKDKPKQRAFQSALDESHDRSDAYDNSISANLMYSEEDKKRYIKLLLNNIMKETHRLLGT